MSASPASVIKIQSRASRGSYTRWRWALVWITQLVFYGIPWLSWDGRQAVLFDLDARRFYLFGAVLFPHDLIYLTLLLVFSALLLFFATTLAGRVWCGYACPQTVYTELFQWIEHRTEGDRLARMRLDAAPWGAPKLLRRGGKHLAWGVLSLWTGLTLVGWFTPLRELVAALPGGAVGPWEAFWILFYALATYGNAGWLREKVCQQMCPYARFQGSMLDRDTLIVGYDVARGEPRGSRRRGEEAGAAGRGDCVDCTLCVQVCPVGIDIRHGFQSACISCGVCIDACDTVMDKLRTPRGLIRFASARTLMGEPAPASALLHALRRPRVLIYGGLLLLCGAALVGGMWLRPTLRVDAMRDRGVMARQLEDGGVENLYRLQLMNASGRERVVALGVEGAAGLHLPAPVQLTLPPGGSQWVTLNVLLNADAAAEAAARAGVGVLTVRFVAREQRPEGGEQAQTASTFLLPR